MAQRPKLAPHIPQMRGNMAQALGISSGCLSVKATTTEKLGFVGREEGMAAQAVALVAIIHGTTDDTSVGRNVSNGCIRMLKPDVEEVFTMLMPGDVVEIVE